MLYTCVYLYVNKCVVYGIPSTIHTMIFKIINKTITIHFVV